MPFLRRAFSSNWFIFFSVMLTLGLLAILGAWQRTELRRGADEYRRTMEELGYVWYDRVNQQFLSFEELFTLPQNMDIVAENALVRLRWQFWTRHSNYPQLIKAVFRVHQNNYGSQSRSHEPVVFTLSSQGQATQAIDRKAIFAELSAHLGGTTSPGQSYRLYGIGSNYYMVLNYGQPSYYVIELETEVIFNQFINQITRQMLPKVQSALPGFNPAIIKVSDGPTLLNYPDSSLAPSSWYSLFYLGDRIDLADQPSVHLDKELADGLNALQLGNSYYLKVWLNREAMVDGYPAAVTKETIDSANIRKGVVFAFFSQQGDIETVVFLRSLPLFALGYIAIGLMGVSLLTASGYNRKMVQLLTRQEEFVATMTHELRTPLHIIANGASNLSDGIVSKGEDVAKYGALIHSETLRLSEMVESILGFAGITNRHVVFHQIDLPRLIGEALAPYRLICREQNIQLEETIRGNSSCVGDPEAVRLVVSNLLSNAIKHAGVGKWIGFSITANNDLSIMVQDRGPGISKREIPKVTDPFFRSDRLRQDRSHGTGLGLSIVKRIAETEKGSFTITSEEGKGSSFLVRLPYQVREARKFV